VAAKTRRTGLDPIHDLTNDHREVERLFARLEAAKGQAREKAFLAVKDALTLHATLEEGIFYPAVMSLPDVEAMRLVSEAVGEHGDVKGLLGEIDASDPRDATYLSKCVRLRDAVLHHATEEEEEMFPLAKRLLGSARLEALGERMTAARRAREAVERPRKTPRIASKQE
jgi:hemerythrin superfamily protein